MGVGLHQESALSPILLGKVIERLTDNVMQETMMFADDIVICCESRMRACGSGRVLWGVGAMTASRGKTEHISVSDRRAGGKVEVQV